MDKIQGNKVRDEQLVTWFVDGVERVWTLVPLTRSIKRQLAELREEADQLLAPARDRDERDIQGNLLTTNAEDELLVGNALQQITLLTNPKTEDAAELGDVVRGQWEADEAVEADVFQLANRLVAAAGKPSAS